MFKFFHWQVLLLLLPHNVHAFPVSYTHAETYTPFATVFISIVSLAVVFLSVKLVYMKLRRIGTIHAPDGAHSRNRFRDKRGNRHRGLWVGCLGSPVWETHLVSRLDGVTSWRLRNQRHSASMRSMHSSTRTWSKSSTANSRFTKSIALTDFPGHADPLLVPSSSVHPKNLTDHGVNSPKAFISTRQDQADGHLCYGDFGKSCHFKSPADSVPKVRMRRASPSSIRLVDGPSHSNQVEYPFLSGLPPATVVVSPFMGTRDSFQLSRCSLRCHRKPVLPLLPLPSFKLLSLHALRDSEMVHSHARRESEYLPPLRFSPISGIIKAFHPQHLFEKKVPNKRTPGHEESKDVIDKKVACMVSRQFVSSSGSSKFQHANNTGSIANFSMVQGTPPLHVVRQPNERSNHKRFRSQSCKGVAIGGAPPPVILAASEVAAALPLGSENNGCGAIEPTRVGVSRISSGSSGDSSIASKKPLKSCLRQNSTVSTSLVSSRHATLTPSISETNTRIWTMDPRCSVVDQASIRTPLSEIDIGILGLDRFRWNDEIKELKVRSSHMRKDSVALVPYWE